MKGKSVERLKDGSYRVRIRSSRIFEDTVAIGKTEKDAWKNLARDLARENLDTEKQWSKQDRALDKIRRAVREVDET